MDLFGFFRPRQEATVEDQNVKKIIVQFEEQGTSGTEIYSGYLQEEYLDTLTGKKKAEIYDEMRRGESEIKMVVSAVKNPIKHAEWFFKPANELTSQKYITEFLTHVIFDDLDKTWMQKLHEILSMIEFGYSLFEVTHKVVHNHKKFGTYIGVKELGWRSQKTIEKWNIDKLTGQLKSVTQMAFGDLDNKQKDLDAQFLYLFSLEQEGDNFEGISMLRPCYGAWFRKKNFLKYLSVGIERFATPTPIGKCPTGQYTTEEHERFKQILQSYTTHQKQWITLPAGWDIEFADNKFEPEKTRSAINDENKEMVKAFLANFLELGIGTTTGSYSLSFDQSDFFLGGIEHIAKTICEVFNRKIIPDLVKANFGPQDKYPTLEYAGISDKVGEEFSRMIQNLVSAKVIVPDLELEKEVRRRAGLPPISLLDQRSATPPAPVIPGMPPVPGQPQPMGFHEHTHGTIMFSEMKNPKNLMVAGTDSFKEIMQKHVKAMGESLIDQIMTKYQTSTPSNQNTAVKDNTIRGSTDYRDELLEAMSLLSEKALDQVEKEVKPKKAIKWVESRASLKFAKSSFDRLPKKMQKEILARLGLTIDSQKADIEKAINFQYIASAASTDSTKIVRSDLEEALEKYVQGASVGSAASNTASFLVNDTRKAYFFSPEVLEEVQGFEFVNSDPVSPICQDLNGTQFRADDPQDERYMPPLHHNCKSYLVPILMNEKFKPSPEGLRPSSPELEKSITL